MMNLRTILTLFVLVALSGISLVAALQVLAPPAHTANGDEQAQLRNGLLARDLSKLSLPEQRRILRLLNGTGRTDADWSELSAAASSAERQRSAENADTLGRIWFEDKAEYFASLHSSRQAAFLDVELAGLPQQPILRLLAPDHELDSPQAAIELLKAREKGWRAQASARQQKVGPKYLAALEARTNSQYLRDLPKWLLPGR